MIFINTSKIMSGNDIIKSQSNNIEGKNSSFAPGSFNSSASGTLTSALSKVANSYSTISTILNNLYTFLNNYSSDAEGGEYSLSDSGGEIIDDAVYAAIKNCEDLLEDISMGSELFTSQMDMSTDNNDSNKYGAMPILPSSLLKGFFSSLGLLEKMNEPDEFYINLSNLCGIDFFRKPEKEGTVIEGKYTSGYNNRSYEVGYSVYLPPDYNENEKYNIAILLDGQNIGVDYGNSLFKLGRTITTPQGQNNIGFNGQMVFDNLFNSGEIDSTIIVTLDYDTVYSSNAAKLFFHDDLMYELLPTIAQEYSTYIDSNNPTPESIIENRDHALFGGYSAGGLFAYNEIPSVLDIFGNYAFYSPAAGMNNNGVVKAINESSYSIRSLFFSSGANEFTTAKGMHIKNAVKTLNDGCNDELTYGENFVFSTAATDNGNGSYSLGHQPSNAFINMVNSLSFIFPNNN